MNKQTAIDLTSRWLKEVVIGLNLCPFASRVLQDNTLRLAVSDAVDDEAIASAVLMELDYLHSNDDRDVATSLLIFPLGLKGFDHYLATLDHAQDLLERAGLEGIIQIASFHPDYCFAGVSPNDLANYTNRSPLPMFHFIREAQLERALAHYPYPEKIPENNIKALHAMGRESVLRLYNGVLANH